MENKTNITVNEAIEIIENNPVIGEIVSGCMELDDETKAFVLKTIRMLGKKE